jgi:hypothetical protein
MASRGLLSRLEEIGPDGVEMLIAHEGHKEKGFDEAVQSVLKGGKTGLIGEQELESKAIGKGVKVKIDALAKEIFNNHAVSQNSFNRMSAGSLLILAHDYQGVSYT